MNRSAIEGELAPAEPLSLERHINGRIVGAAIRGAEHGGVIGVETALAPAVILCYGVPFILHFVWGFVLTACSLVGAFTYGVRKVWYWLCTAK